MFKPENKDMMVRGYVVAASRYCGGVAKDDPECVTAYTHWFRHDDNLEVLAFETRKLQELYMSFSKTSSMMIGYEYKKYPR